MRPLRWARATNARSNGSACSGWQPCRLLGRRGVERLRGRSRGPAAFRSRSRGRRSDVGELAAGSLDGDLPDCCRGNRHLADSVLQRGPARPPESRGRSVEADQRAGIGEPAAQSIPHSRNSSSVIGANAFSISASVKPERSKAALAEPNTGRSRGGVTGTRRATGRLRLVMTTSSPRSTAWISRRAGSWPRRC